MHNKSVHFDSNQSKLSSDQKRNSITSAKELLDKGTGTGIDEDESHISQKMLIGGLEDVDGVYNVNNLTIDS